METPRYEYSRAKITERIAYLQNLDAPHGVCVRYAIKANPHPDIIQMIHEAGLHFDASSSYEAQELLDLGIPGHHISLSSQQSPHNLTELLSAGVLFVATSINQLQQFVDTDNHPDTVGVRINPDIDYGHNQRTSTSGVGASFGIWHEYLDSVLDMIELYDVTINRLHIHVGSGGDPGAWGTIMDRALAIACYLPDVDSLDIGGGFKVHRFEGEQEADLTAIMTVFQNKLVRFATDHNRNLRLEIEPGTYLVAHAGVLVAEIDDIVDTGADGYTFLRLNTGMNDFLRSAMYGAQHKIRVLNESINKQEYVVVGHNCESGDVFTPVKGDPEKITPRLLNQAVIGDEVRIYDMGAYCASMRAKGYNSFPDAIEYMVD